MSEAFRLFVYGQLRRGQIGHERLGLANRTSWLGEARIQGELYDFGDYPGLSLEGDGMVHGELLAFDDAALWPMLDAYEDCDPENPALSEYCRVETGLLDDASPAWVYIYNRATGGLAPISSGNWCRRDGAREEAPVKLIARHVRISGKVQGVFYRGWTVKAARSLGLVGWVRNRLDGDVEAFIQGAEADIERFLTMARRGPSAAQVEDVRDEPAEVASISGFEQRPTC